MTYQELLDCLLTLAPERLQDTVTVFDPYGDEYTAVIGTEVSDEAINDVLDDGHLFLVMKA
jgi:hypothetical protein